jgi:predicted Zn-dependent protease
MGGAWGWVRRHWLDLLLPPTAFLLAAAICRQVYWTREGLRYRETERHYRAAAVAMQRGQREAALRELLTASRTAPGDPPLNFRVGTALKKLGQPERAAQHFERAVRRMPPNGNSYIGLVRTWCEVGRYDEAERVLRQDVLPRWPHSPDALYYEGLIRRYRQTGTAEIASAARCFQRAWQIDPRHLDARYEYGACQARLGRLDEAERVFREVMKAAPTYPGVYQGLADVLRQQGRRAEAKQVLADLQRLEDRKQRMRYLETRRGLRKAQPGELLELGGLYLAFDRLPAAETVLTEYTLLQSADPHGHRKLAVLYRRQGKPVNARSEQNLAAALERTQRR